VTHPIELLAGAADGSLAPDDRAQLDEHLRACSQCSEELGLAAAARQTLRTLPEPSAPNLAAGFTPDRIDALTAPTSGSPSLTSKLVPALAAAAVVALVALVIPRLITTRESADRAAAPASQELVIDGLVRLQVEDTDYDTPTLKETLADLTAAMPDSRPADAPAPADAAAPTETAAEGGPDGAASGLRIAPGKTRKAAACLKRAFPGYPGEIVQVRQATFEGEPALLGVVLESALEVPPAGGLSIWVAAVEDCSILTIASVPR
jgi:hypothetical protein